MADHGKDFSDTGSKQSQPEVVNGELKVTPQLERLWNDFMDELKDKERRKDDDAQQERSSSGKPKSAADSKTVEISPYPGYGNDYTAAPTANAGSPQKEGGLDYRPMPKDPGGLDYPDFASDPNAGKLKVPTETYSDLPYALTDQPEKKKERSWEVQEMIDTIDRIDKWTDEQKASDRKVQQSAREARVNPIELANKAVDEFNRATDKPEALERLAAQFQRAIELSDTQAKARMKQIAGSLAISESERANARAAKEQADAMIEVSKMAVPEDQKGFVNQKLNAYENSVTNGGKQNALKEISRVAPDLAMAIEAREQITSQAAPILAKEDATLKRLEQAVETPIAVRETFAGALEMAGKMEQAAQMKKQAMDIFINVLLAQDRAKQPPQDYSAEAAPEPKEPVVEWEV